MIARSCTELISVFVGAGRLQEAIETAHHGLSYLHGDLSAGRARLLAVLGQSQATAGTWEPADQALREALKIASHISNPKLAARLHRARFSVNYQFLRLKEAGADCEKSRGSDAPPWEAAITLQVLYQALLFLGRLDDAAKIRDELEPLATKIGQSYSISRCLITRAWVDFGAAPDLTKLETAIQQVLKSDPKLPAVFWDVFSEDQLKPGRFPSR
jgi:tetratricopeptide (TPR) repeat protein